MIGFAMDWGMDGLHVANIFAYRSTDPRVLTALTNPAGMDNDSHILDMASTAEIVVGAWGTHGRLRGRGVEVARLLREAGVELQCLGCNADGSPKHPLYLKSDAPLVPLAAS